MAARKQNKNWLWPGLILGCVVLTLAPIPLSQIFEPVRNLFSLLLYPVTSPLYAVSSNIQDRMLAPAQADSIQIQQYQDQIKSQQNLIIQLKQENASLKLQQRHLGVVKEALQSPQVELVPARIIGRGRGSASYHYELNQGANQGIKVGMPVLGGKYLEGPYLIGRIIKVGPRTAVFEALNRPELELGVTISKPTQQDSRSVNLSSRPMVAGQDGLWMTKVSNAEGVSPGDLVRLNDRSVSEWGSWPPSVQGWLLGEVVEIKNISDDHLRKHVMIRPVMSHFGTRVTVVVPSELPVRPSLAPFESEEKKEGQP